MESLFLDISDYLPDPEVEAVEAAVRHLSVGEDYKIVSSVSNHSGWEKLPMYSTPPRGERGRFIKVNTHP